MDIISALKKMTTEYLHVIWSIAIIFITLVIIELFANFEGWLFIPGIFFLLSIIAGRIISYSPPAIIFSFISSLYTMIPILGDMSIGETTKETHEKVKKLVVTAFDVLALTSLFLTTVYINSDLYTQITISFCFLLGFSIFAWHAHKTDSPAKVVWKFVFVAGFLMLGKATALLFPMPIHDTLGIYPGLIVDKSVIVSKTRSNAQRDATIYNNRNIAAITNFESILEKFPKKTTTEIIRDKQSLLDMKVISQKEFDIIEAEETRQNNTPTKALLNKVESLTKSGVSKVSEIFTDDPEPIWTTVGEMSYLPNRPGWTRITRTLSDKTESVCRIRCVQGFRYKFEDKTHFSKIQCSGWKRAEDLILENSNFYPYAQLIKVHGVTSVPETRPFTCSDTVTAEFKHNADESDFNIKSNAGKPHFVIEKLIKPTS